MSICQTAGVAVRAPTVGNAASRAGRRTRSIAAAASPATSRGRRAAFVTRAGKCKQTPKTKSTDVLLVFLAVPS